MDIIGAIKRPFSDGKKLLIGMLMYVIPVLNLITSFFGLGYVLKSASMSLKKDKRLPEWDSWGELFVKGLLAVVISMIWSIPLWIVLGIVAGTAISAFLGSLAAAQANGAGAMAAVSALTGAGAGASAVIIAVLSIVLVYVVPSAILNFVKEDRFGGAFSIRTVFKNAFTGKYFVAWLASVLVMFIFTLVLGAINGALLLIPVIGWMLSLVIMAVGAFAGAMIYMTILAEAYGEL